MMPHDTAIILDLNSVKHIDYTCQVRTGAKHSTDFELLRHSVAEQKLTGHTMLALET